MSGAGPFCICLICYQSRSGSAIPTGWKMTESGMRCAGCLIAQSLCAAGPWRTDVENAPRNGSEVWCEFEELGTTLQVSAGWSNDHHAWFDGFGRSYSDTLLTAFAVPNPPQVKP